MLGIRLIECQEKFLAYWVYFKLQVDNWVPESTGVFIDHWKQDSKETIGKAFI